MELGALLAIVTISPQFAIDLQPIGGVIVLQTLPAGAIGVFTRWFHARALIAGWVADGPDATSPADYTAEAGDPAVKPLPEVGTST